MRTLFTTPRRRRPLALLLIILGGALMFLAAEAWFGALLLALGVAVEAAGIRLDHSG